MGKKTKQPTLVRNWECSDCGTKSAHKDKICRSCLNKEEVAAYETGVRKGQADLIGKIRKHMLAIQRTQQGEKWAWVDIIHAIDTVEASESAGSNKRS